MRDLKWVDIATAEIHTGSRFSVQKTPVGVIDDSFLHDDGSGCSDQPYPISLEEADYLIGQGAKDRREAEEIATDDTTQ